MKEKTVQRERMITVPSSATFDKQGNIVCNYIMIPLWQFEAWLKHCYELSGDH